MANEKPKPKKKVVRKVAGTTAEEAYKKGQRSGRASANAKKPTRKKGPKQYRMKKFIPHMKNSYGKFQSKHPYISTTAEVATVGAILLGTVSGIANKLGAVTYPLSQQVVKIPVAGGFYQQTQKAVINLIEKVMR